MAPPLDACTPGPVELETSRPSKLAAKYDAKMETPALFAPEPNPPEELMLTLVKVVVESTKYSLIPTASLSSRTTSSIHAPEALISIVDVARPAVFAPRPPVPVTVRPSIIAA